MNDTQTTGPQAPHLTAADFQPQLDKAGETPVFVDFYAEWCGPCKISSPIIDRMSEEYKGKAILTKLDVDDNPEIAQKFGVMSIPTVIVFKNGKEVDRKVGFPGEPFYRQMIDKAVGGEAAKAA